MAAAEIGQATVCGIDLEVLRAGAGDPILLLHGMQTLSPESHFLERLAALGRVIAPSAPGFGDSPRPKDFDTVYDLVHLHHALLDSLPGGDVTLIGVSFGGWLAAEVAARRPHRLRTQLPRPRLQPVRRRQPVRLTRPRAGCLARNGVTTLRCHS